jgi:outer membrane protein assembly factor BamB
MRRIVNWRLAAASLVLLPAIAAQAIDWPQWRGPLRDGHSTEALKNTDWEKNPPRLLWTVEGMGQGYASMSIADGKLYTTGNTKDGQSVVCADAETGKVLWSTPVTEGEPKHGYEGSRSTPTLDGDRLYIVASDGQLVCLKNTGDILWKRSFTDFGGQMMSGWGYSESPLVDGDQVVCTPGGKNAVIVAFNKMTGQDLWQTPMPDGAQKGKDGAGYSSIVVSEGAGVRQYVQMTGRGLISVRASDGQFLWGYDKVANDVANIPTPLVSGDYVFASTGYDTGAALIKMKKKGEKVLASEEYFIEPNVFQNHHGGMVLEGDYVYGGHGSNQGFPTCLNWKTGKIKWGGKLRGAGQGSAALTAVGEWLIFRYQDGTLALVEATPKGYQLHGSFMPAYQERESWSHPVVVGGRMYLREQDKLMCYDLGA